MVDVAPIENCVVIGDLKQFLNFLLAFHRDGVDPTLAHPSLATQSGHGVLRRGHILNDTLTVNDQTDVRNHAQKLGKSGWIEVFGVHWYCKLSSVM